MAQEAVQGKKPTGPIDVKELGNGLAKAPESEVSGHIIGYFRCWNCDNVAWVQNNLNGYICPYCYAVNIEVY
jgi:hypothetical protein